MHITNSDASSIRLKFLEYRATLKSSTLRLTQLILLSYPWLMSMHDVWKALSEPELVKGEYCRLPVNRIEKISRS